MDVDGAPWGACWVGEEGGGGRAPSCGGTNKIFVKTLLCSCCVLSPYSSCQTGNTDACTRRMKSCTDSANRGKLRLYTDPV